jgi:hypothetical protein
MISINRHHEFYYSSNKKLDSKYGSVKSAPIHQPTDLVIDKNKIKFWPSFERQILAECTISPFIEGRAVAVG